MRFSRKSTHNYHKTLATLPIFRYNELQESIRKGKIDYRHLLVLEPYDELPEINIDFVERLKMVYDKMITELPMVNTDILTTYREYFSSYLRVYRDRIANSIDELEGHETVEQKYAEHNRYFADYVNLLNANFTNFEIPEYYLNDNINETFKKYYPDLEIPRELKILQKEIQAFYVFTRYFYEIDNMKIDKAYKDLFKSKSFTDTFINVRIIKIDDIYDYIDRIKYSFKLSNQYGLFMDFRFYMFNLQKLKCEPYREPDFFEELINIKQLTGVDIDIHRTSTLEYMNLKKEAKAKIDRKLLKKDKSAGNG
jgi:hypothetical protein